MKSYLDHLECTSCSRKYSADELHGTCLACGKVLYARYDIDGARDRFRPGSLAGRPANMWRYFEMLPVRDEAEVVTLGEGFTPLISARRLGSELGSNALYIKDEGLNPTATFKSRGMAAAVSRAREFGVAKLSVPTAGNAGGALAMYAASAGLEAHIFMPKDAQGSNVKEANVSGARVTMVDGLIDEAGRSSREAVAELGLFDLSTFREPYRAEGKKTMGYEIAEQFEWDLPDAIVYPTGGGTGIVGIWKAFQEMQALGWIGDKRPKMFCVQAANCAPLVRAFQQGHHKVTAWENPRTIAGGLRVPSPFADYIILNVLRESGGGALSVSDAEMLTWMRRAASLEGVFMCPEGAATVAAAAKLLSDGTISPDERVVLLNTGSGLKYLDLLPMPG